MKQILRHFKQDASAGLVVFFVALPLCLGIALASGAPLFAGLIAGIVGGIIVGAASKSQVGVSGPAAGLAVIVLNAIEDLGSWNVFLLAVALAGVLQLLMGFLRLGVIAYYFPSSVIKGMLTGIGIIIILKQIPHALGYDAEFEGSESFTLPDGENTFTMLEQAFQLFTPGAIIIAAISMAILLLWDTYLSSRHRIFQILQGPLVVVLMGIGLTWLFQSQWPSLQLAASQMVQIPTASSAAEFAAQFTMPDLSAFSNPEVYIVAATIAVVASLETLLCVEATDKLDPLHRITPTNRELKAQGLGNMISGMIGGLPITQVIVRSSANISFGARTQVSAVVHGFLLLFCVIAIPTVLNLIPLASLACILIIVGYKLAKPTVFKQMYRLGWSQFVPFMATVAGVVFTDLLRGIGIGLVVAVFFILRNNYRNSYYITENRRVAGKELEYNVVLAEEVSFLNKASFLQMLNHVPENATIVIDGTRSRVIDHDIIEVIDNFRTQAELKNIRLDLVGLDKEKLV